MKYDFFFLLFVRTRLNFIYFRVKQTDHTAVFYAATFTLLKISAWGKERTVSEVLFLNTADLGSIQNTTRNVP